MLLDNAVQALFPLLLTEYGLLSRRTAQERLIGKWRPLRSVVRLAFWLGLWLHAGANSPAALRAGIGFGLGELGALALRRRMRQDNKMGRAHGSPWTHFTPLGVALLFAAALLAASRLGPGGFQVPRAGAHPLAIATGFLALWNWGTMLTVSVIDLARPEQISDAGEPAVGPGELIGVLERVITFVLVLGGALSAVGFVIAAKAAARFPEFKNKAFAEYFLVGTLTSAGLAVLIGLLVAAH